MLKKFQCILLLKFSFDGSIFSNLYFDIPMTYVQSPIFLVYMHDKQTIMPEITKPI